MKPITEQRRQELIADCEKEIEHAEKLLLSAGLAIGWQKVHENNLLKHQIVLASLNAKSKVTLFSDERDYDQYSFEVNERIPDGVHELYTTPPVPVVDLPDEIEGLEHSEYGSGKKDGWNLCLDEIKRRNGLGE